MPNRLHEDEVKALLQLRNNIIGDYNRILDGAAAPESAMCKQSDVARSFTQTIRGIEEILSTAADVTFKGE